MFRSCTVTVQTTSVEQNSSHFKADMFFFNSSRGRMGYSQHHGFLIHPRNSETQHTYSNTSV